MVALEHIVYPPLAEVHPAIGLPCMVCRQTFVAGDRTTLVGMTPADEDEVERARERRVYIASSGLVHARCVGGEA